MSETYYRAFPTAGPPPQHDPVESIARGRRAAELAAREGDGSGPTNAELAARLDRIEALLAKLVGDEQARKGLTT